MRDHADRQAPGAGEIPPGPDLRSPREGADAERIPVHDGRRGAHEAGSLPPLPIRPLPEPPAGLRAWVRFSRRLRRGLR